MVGGGGYDTDLGSKKRVLEEHVKDLLSKGYSKKEIKKRLLEGGYNWVLVNKHLYPYLSVLVISGMILIAMILIIGSVAGFSLFWGGASDDSGEDLTPASTPDTGDLQGTTPTTPPRVEIPESVCRRYLEDPTKYEGRDDYDQYVEQCGELDLTVVFDCTTILDETWKERCIEEVADEGYFRSEETWKKVTGE